MDVVGVAPADMRRVAPDVAGVDKALMERAWLLALILAAALLRFWALGSKGLWYDEAITAAMTHLSIPEIARFHWQSAFTHIPGWYILLNLWAKVFGTSEAALRLPSVIAGVLVVPLVWQILRLACRTDRILRLVGAGLVSFSPLLVLYSQEARMYAIATTLALASVYLSMRLASRSGAVTLGALILVNWLMLAFQYYFVLLIGIEGLFVLMLAATRRLRPIKLLAALAVSCLPLALRALAPGFQMTAETLASTTGQLKIDWMGLLDGTWRDLAFGMVIWQPRESLIGYALLAPFVVGLVAAGCRRCESADATPISWPRCFLLIVALPGLITALFLGDFHTRYILYVAPFFLMIVALGIVTLWRVWRPLGAIAFAAAGAVAVAGLLYYFGTYQRSAYRDVALYLTQRARPGDVVLLEGPRQHLLADYYLPRELKVVPVPDVPLPAHLPSGAPKVIPGEIDRQLKPLLEIHPNLWLVLAGEDEVDPAEFVLSYLSAAAYRLACRDWLDVTLCHFLAPASLRSAGAHPLDIAFQGEMRLRGADISAHLVTSAERYLLVNLNWETSGKPAKDYKVTLRLLDAGGKVVSQADDFPIGSLLPPTTWGEDGAQTGHMVLPVPAQLPPGDYVLALGLYDPASLAPVPVVAAGTASPDLVNLALVRVDGMLQIMPF
jgi:uncharacterized membrane protein